MTLQEAISHAREASNRAGICPECAGEHRQLADWLEELQRYQESGLTPEDIYCMSQTLAADPKDVERLLTAEAEGRLVEVVRCGECEKWKRKEETWCSKNFGYCSECMMDCPADHFCSYGERKEARK